MKTWVLVVALLAVAAALLGGREGGPADIHVIKSSGTVEKHLRKHKDTIGDDYAGYRGHVYRVLTYAMHILKGDETHRAVIEAALVFHDIGLWTDGELSYLEPSWARAKAALAGSLEEDELELVREIIVQHHKITEFRGDNAAVVNAVRRGDWIDASGGVLAMGVSRANIAKVQREIPNQGFHQTLLSIGPRLHGWNVPKIVMELAKVFRY